MAPGPTGTTIEEEAGAVSMRITYEKRQKPTHGNSNGGGGIFIIIITVIISSNSDNIEVTAEMINKSEQ